MGSKPKVPPAPPSPPPPPTPVDPGVLDARNRERLRSLAAMGRRSTIKTGPQGLTGPAPIASASLLGGGVAK